MDRIWQLKTFYYGLTREISVSKTIRGYKYIVLHHTATRCMSAEEMKQSMYNTYVANKWFAYIPTHYIVWCSGDWIKVNELDHIVWATLNWEANRNWIHIEIVGDFNIWDPYEVQYETVNQLIQRILEKHPNMEIKWHGDFQAKNCPWVNFDWSKIVKEKREYIDFSLSRYYTVVPNQSRYYNWRTYEEDFAMNCAGNCNTTANWHILTDADMYKSVACPKEYELWTRIYLEWIGEVVCNDRWWAIIWNRIDMRCWIWDKALNNWSKCPTWSRRWYVL